MNEERRRRVEVYGGENGIVGEEGKEGDMRDGEVTVVVVVAAVVEEREAKQQEMGEISEDRPVLGGSHASPV